MRIGRAFAGKLHLLHEVSKTLILGTSRSVSISLLETEFIRTDNFKIADLSVATVSPKRTMRPKILAFFFNC